MVCLAMRAFGRAHTHEGGGAVVRVLSEVLREFVGTGALNLSGGLMVNG